MKKPRFRKELGRLLVWGCTIVLSQCYPLTTDAKDQPLISMLRCEAVPTNGLPSWSKDVLFLYSGGKLTATRRTTSHPGKEEYVGAIMPDGSVEISGKGFYDDPEHSQWRSNFQGRISASGDTVLSGASVSAATGVRTPCSIEFSDAISQLLPGAILSSSHAGLLIADPHDEKKFDAIAGTAQWSTIAPNAGQPQTLGVRIDVDIPARKLHATLMLQKNTEAGLSASHTLDLRFNFDDGADIRGIADMGLPQLREEHAATGTKLVAVRVKIDDRHYIVGLTSSDSDVAQNLDLLAHRSWLDIPLLFDSGRIAKLTFEKGASGERVMSEALDAWGFSGEHSAAEPRSTPPADEHDVALPPINRASPAMTPQPPTPPIVSAKPQNLTADTPKADNVAKFLAKMKAEDEQPSGATKPFNSASSGSRGEASPLDTAGAAKKQQDLSGDRDAQSWTKRAEQFDNWLAQTYIDCWTQPARTPAGDPYVPAIRISFNPDGSLSIPPELVNPPSDSRWNYYAASAMQAVLKCNPLHIPDEYAPYFMKWKVKTVHFSPKARSSAPAAPKARTWLTIDFARDVDLLGEVGTNPTNDASTDDKTLQACQADGESLVKTIREGLTENPTIAASYHIAPDVVHYNCTRSETAPRCSGCGLDSDSERSQRPLPYQVFYTTRLIGLYNAGRSLQIRAENLAKDQADKARQQEESKQPAKFVVVVRRRDAVWGLFHGMFAYGGIPWPSGMHTPEECRASASMLPFALGRKLKAHPEMLAGTTDDITNFHASCEMTSDAPECAKDCQNNSQIFN
jgi:hypothetical protein